MQQAVVTYTFKGGTRQWVCYEDTKERMARGSLHGHAKVSEKRITCTGDISFTTEEARAFAAFLVQQADYLEGR